MDYAIIDSDIGLSSIRRQAIILTNYGVKWTIGNTFHWNLS